MKKIIALAILLQIVFYQLSISQTQYTIEIDKTIASGVRYQKLVGTSPNENIYILKVNLANSNIGVESVKASDKYKGDRQVLSTMVNNHDAGYHKIIGAINGDFFSVTDNSKMYEINPGWSLQLQVVNGELVSDEVSERPIFVLDDNSSPSIIESISPSYTIVAPNGQSLSINRINKTRGSDQLVMYNRFANTDSLGNCYTSTLNNGTEVLIVPNGGRNSWTTGTIECTVFKKEVNIGNMHYLPGQAVLSGHGIAKTFLNNNVNDGDVISLHLNATSDNKRIKQMTGGYPQLLNAGQNVAVESSKVGHNGIENTAYTQERNPRTAIGISQDKSMLYMVVVDGRRDGSVGMNVVELADFMKNNMGAYDAMNLDGGGSSEIIADGVIQNIPSGLSGVGVGMERPLVQALFVYAKTYLLDDFESGVGHFNSVPTFSASTKGISNTSAVEQATNAKYCGSKSLRVRIYDDPSISDSWIVRLNSGHGRPEENTEISPIGTVRFRLATSSAKPDATVELWVDDEDGTEISQAIPIVSDCEWHEYSFDLAHFNGSPLANGNGVLNGDKVTIDAIVLRQGNTPDPWYVYLDYLIHDPDGQNTTRLNIKSNNNNTADLKGTGLSDIFSKFSIYPNPNKGKFFIGLGTEKLNDCLVEIFDLSGIKVLSTKLRSNQLTVDADELHSGLYFVKVEGKGYKLVTKMSVKK